jgi:hypothetical protein
VRGAAKGEGVIRERRRMLENSTRQQHADLTHTTPHTAPHTAHHAQSHRLGRPRSECVIAQFGVSHTVPPPRRLPPPP